MKFNHKKFIALTLAAGMTLSVAPSIFASGSQNEVKESTGFYLEDYVKTNMPTQLLEKIEAMDMPVQYIADEIVAVGNKIFIFSNESDIWVEIDNLSNEDYFTLQTFPTDVETLTKIKEMDASVQYLGKGVVTVSNSIFIFAHEERVEHGEINFNTKGNYGWAEIINSSEADHVNLSTFPRDHIYYHAINMGKTMEYMGNGLVLMDRGTIEEYGIIDTWAAEWTVHYLDEYIFDYNDMQIFDFSHYDKFKEINTKYESVSPLSPNFNNVWSWSNGNYLARPFVYTQRVFTQYSFTGVSQLTVRAREDSRLPDTPATNLTRGVFTVELHIPRVGGSTVTQSAQTTTGIFNRTFTGLSPSNVHSVALTKANDGGTARGSLDVLR